MKISKSLALLLAAAMLTSSVVSCGSAPTTDNQTDDSTQGSGSDTSTPVDEKTNELDEIAKLEDYDAKSEKLYNHNLGEFYDAYMTAKEEVTDVSKRYALMAIAEAKLLESGVMLPTSSQGGNYAISRVAPYTFDFALWGGDQDRFHQAIVCTEPITAADRQEMKAKWTEVKGTGTYEAWAKKFLTDKGYKLKDTYTMGYASDPQTWDALATSRAADSEAIVNTFDCLLEYDVEGTLKPALAESYTVSDDGLTYTFKIRKGVIWVDSQGRKVADLKADDFVAGMQHMCDAKGGLEWLIEGVIVGASDYINGVSTDFSKVGVKATDDNTLVFTLEQPTSYFLTMLGYNCFAPLSRDYYTSKGGKFGEAFDASAENYTYGKDPNSIAYCGPYLVTNATEKNTIVFKLNESYWNKDNINAKSIVWLYNDGSDVTKAYNDAVSGVLDGAGLNSSALELAKKDDAKYPFATYAYTSSTDATSFMAFLNVNRAAFANVSDATKVVSSQTDDQKYVAYHALNNQNFRLALDMAVDRGAYNAQSVGEELKNVSLRNSYTPWNFVYLEEDVTVAINGKDTKFAKGTPYGAIVQAQIDADGYKLTVYDPKADNGNGSGDGFDGWYNAANAKEQLNLAIKALAEEGITIDKDHPVVLDLPYPSSNATFTNKANAFKQSVEKALDGVVIINLTEGKDTKEWYYAGYYTDFGYEANYDVYDVSGWGPDYGDPSSYLDTFLPDYAGYMVKCIGLY